MYACQDAPPEEVILIDVLVKQLKLDLLSRKLRQNHLDHGRHKIKSKCKPNIYIK